MKFRMKPGVGDHVIFPNGSPKIMKPGDEITCGAAELGGAIDKFVVLEEDAPSPPSRFKIISTPGGYYDVIHPVNGIAINSKKLRKAEAEALAGMTVEEYDAKVAKEAEEAEAAKEAEEAEAAKMETGDQTGEGDGGQ